MNDRSHHAEWLGLIDVSGPFLAEPVLKDAFPQGLEGLDASKKRLVRQAYDEWREALDLDDPEFPKIHRAWIDLVLARVLELDENGTGDVLKSVSNLPETLRCDIPERGVSLLPDHAVFENRPDGRALLLIVSYGEKTALTEPFGDGGYVASPAERMVELCRGTGVRLGLVTNGEQWVLVDAPVGAVVSLASWYARHWNQEPVTLQAFVNLLGVRRFFVDRSQQLPALLDNSLKYQDEVTDALGGQVARAVEVLIQALDRADIDRDRELLVGIEPHALYEAGLTVMMRIVFLLSAEERGLLLLGDERYEAGYAVSTLRAQLRNETEEILERRWDAWSRLLSIFRAVFAGVDHEAMRLPALGGSLFDPDRFPFLEGRKRGSRWTNDLATPLPIDNRTVLYLLDAVQVFRGRTLSYLALDIEQIGYVYEGLLERTVVRSKEVTLDLDATKNAKNPWVSLPELDDAAANGRSALEALLKERTGSAATRVRNDLDRTVDDGEAEKLLTACADLKLRNRIKPYFHLLRTDRWGYPIVYPKHAFMVATGTDRRESGTHYTPKSFTEAIVKETLEPLVYKGPADGLPREKWILKSCAQLLDLKVCDMAMGSGAFLVQVCRWLSDRLVEAWSISERQGRCITADGEEVDTLGSREPMRKDVEERVLTARRLIAERCLYGVDMNPLAVELAKLSIWLVTLAKGRPFGFLDHNFRVGDSLLGLTNIEQLDYLELIPGVGSARKLFAAHIHTAVSHAIQLRTELRNRPIRDIRDVEAMAKLDDEARHQVNLPELVADAFIGEALRAPGKVADTTILSIEAGRALEAESAAIGDLVKRADGVLEEGSNRKKTFHWPLEFPEVFGREDGGFDAIVGNPPFLGNRLWKTSLGEGLQWQCQMVLGVPPGKIDLSVVFHRRAIDLLRPHGCYGLLGANNIAEGSAVEVGLGVIVQSGDIYCAKKGMPWPGTAAVVVAFVVFFKGKWQGRCVAGETTCDRIGARLEPESRDVWSPKELQSPIFSFEGVNNSKGLAFVITQNHDWFHSLKAEENSLLRPYVTGNDITSHALRKVDRWALDIADRSLDEIEKGWPRAFRFLVEVVQPTRDRESLKSYKGLHDRWWQFWNHRADLMRKLRAQENFIAFPKVTKYPFCMVAPSQWIYTNKVLLIEAERVDTFSICLSSFFRNWLYAFSVRSLGADANTLTLSIRESVSTFILPRATVSDAGRTAACRFQDLVVAWSAEHDSGLTAALNAVNDSDYRDSSIEELRQLLSTIDVDVATTYGWGDLDFTYSFEKISGSAGESCRWGPSKNTIAESIRRLTILNKEQYERDIAAIRGGGDTRTNDGRRQKRPKRSGRTPSAVLEGGDDLFSDRGQ